MPKQQHFNRLTGAIVSPISNPTALRHRQYGRPFLRGHPHLPVCSTQEGYSCSSNSSWTFSNQPYKPLFDAIISSDKEKVSEWARSGKPINVPLLDFYGNARSPIALAVGYNDLPIVKLLLDFGANVHECYSTSNALYRAIYEETLSYRLADQDHCQFEIVKTLLDCGANPNICGNPVITPIQLACSRIMDSTSQEVLSKIKPLIELLISYGAHANDQLAQSTKPMYLNKEAVEWVIDTVPGLNDLIKR